MNIEVQENAITSWQTTEKALLINWSDGQQSAFHYIWLKEFCPGLRNKNRQRTGALTDIPQHTAPESVQVMEDGQLKIIWNTDKEASCFSIDWLRKEAYSAAGAMEQWQPKLWDASMMATLPVRDYPSISADKQALRDWLAMFRDYGFAILRNVPRKSGTVAELAEWLSYLKPYIWGEDFFDIEKRVDPDYIALTNAALSLHTDGAYVDPTPAAQMLHCLENTVEGGESILADGFKVATVLREQHPEKFRLLSSLPVRHAYRNKTRHKDYDFEMVAPLIRLNQQGQVEQIRFAYQSIQPFQFPPDLMDAYYSAYYTFNQMIASDEYQIEFKLMPGDLYLFDNYRLLHGRRSFSASGHRHLQGCYLGRDGLWSHLKILNNV